MNNLLSNKMKNVKYLFIFLVNINKCSKKLNRRIRLIKFALIKFKHIKN